MPTEHDAPESPATAPVAPMGAMESHPPRNHTCAISRATEAHDEATMREREGLPPDAIILAPAFTAPPMRCPDTTWALLVSAADIFNGTDPDHAGDVALFAGHWMADQPPAHLCDRDLVVRLVPPEDPTNSLPRDNLVDVEMLLAHDDRWWHVGQWRGLDHTWPYVVAPTAAALMRLHCDRNEAAAHFDAPAPLPLEPISGARGGLAGLLEAGVVTAGDEFIWKRRNHGVCHTARIRGDGFLVLADGQAHANPTGATAALGGSHQNGWHAFQRVSDGRTLHELRLELRARNGQ